MRYSYPQVVFQEVPGEISLSLSISGCNLNCKGCHSKETQCEDFGEELTEEVINNLLLKHKHCSCVLFYGGEWDMPTLNRLINHVKNIELKVALYTGRTIKFFEKDFVQKLDYIKVGPYVEKLGALSCKDTNQRFYIIENGELIDTTNIFFKG